MADYRLMRYGKTWVDIQDGQERTILKRIVSRPTQETFSGLFLVATDHGMFFPRLGMKATSACSTNNEVTLVFDVEKLGIQIKVCFSLDEETSILLRRDTIRNISSAMVSLTDYRARLTFPDCDYDVVRQHGRWCRESQIEISKLRGGGITLESSGRSCEGAVPYIALVDVENHIGIAAHLLSEGNYRIAVYREPQKSDLPYYFALEMGQANNDFRFKLAPGEEYNAPQILYQDIPEGEIRKGATAIGRYARKHILRRSYQEPKVHFNTWFDTFDHLDADRLRIQAKVCAELGVEIFVVDAGWYGKNCWYADIGDWSEKTETAFRGKMKEFAKYVRSLGMGFGLWMEPETLTASAPARTRCPDWFLPDEETGGYYPDLIKEAPYEWVKSEICRLHDTYQLAWMKIDMNRGMMFVDPHRTEFSAYYRRWYQLLDEIAGKYPDFIIEGCASGGMRNDMGVTSHFHTHSLSDSADPVDVLRISWGTALRMPLAYMNKWSVIRLGNSSVPDYSQKAFSEMVLSPTGPVWDPRCDGTPSGGSRAVHPLFPIRAAQTGSWGFSGSLLEFSADVKEIISKSITWYKKWRRFIMSSDQYLLTAPKPITDRYGWAGLLLVGEDRKKALLFAYHLGRANTDWTFRLEGLDPNSTYLIHDPDDKVKDMTAAGAQLLDEGLKVILEHPCTAGIRELAAK